MKITYHNTVRDRLAFAAFHLPRSPMIILITVGFFLFITFESIIPDIPKDKSLAFQIFYVIIAEAIQASIIFAVWTVIVLVGTISKKNKTLAAERTLTFSEDSFVSDTSFAHSEYKWPMVQKLARTGSHIFLYLNKDSAVIVPRRAFESSSQWDEFYDYCQSKTRRAA
jgi:hypothetical protein